MRVQLASSVAARPKLRVQYAAVPWRMPGDSLEILLITTLRTQRCIVPPGCPIAELSPHDCAAHEALEEAGVCGTIGERPIGSFRYLKHRKVGDGVPCKVEVFALEVTVQRRSWPEKGERRLRWCKLDECLDLVGEPGLYDVIARFARSKKGH